MKEVVTLKTPMPIGCNHRNHRNHLLESVSVNKKGGRGGGRVQKRGYKYTISVQKGGLGGYGGYSPINHIVRGVTTSKGWLPFFYQGIFYKGALAPGNRRGGL